MAYTAKHFDKFITACKNMTAKLGLNGLKQSFSFYRPKSWPANVEAGFLLLRDQSKVKIFLNPKQESEPTNAHIQYLAAHEIVELMLMMNFKKFCIRCAAEGKMDYEEWEFIVHDTVHRILNLTEPELLCQKDMRNGRIRKSDG